ncbi:hypothetical protein ES703_71635 [subsurface metagenome]
MGENGAKDGVKAGERPGLGVEKTYIGSTLTPLSLAGLFLGGKAVAQAVTPSVVSALVPVFNGEQTLDACIRALQAQTTKPAEVIVIDDGSTDKTPEILKRLSEEFSNIRTIRNTENLGKASSVNAALREVSSPYTAIVDSDTYLEGEYLEKTLRALDEKVVGASGKILPAKIEGVASRARLIEYLHSQSTYRMVQDRMGVAFVSPGCSSVWRTDWIARNGIPAETVVEDMDLTWEAQMAGMRVSYVPDAIAYTEEPETLGHYFKQIRRWFSWRPVLEKHSGGMPMRLKLLTSWMLVESVVYLAMLGMLFFNLFTGNFSTAFVLLAAELGIITAVSVSQGHKIGIGLWDILTSIPSYFLLRIPTTLMFWKSFIFPMRTGW